MIGMEHSLHYETVLLLSLFEGSNMLRMAKVISNPPKQDQRAVIQLQFLSAKGCKPIEIQRRMVAVYGEKYLSMIILTDVPLRT